MTDSLPAPLSLCPFAVAMFLLCGRALRFCRPHALAVCRVVQGALGQNVDFEDGFEDTAVRALSHVAFCHWARGIWDVC